MQASTPTITPEELAKRMSDPETYACCSEALVGKHRDVENCLCSFCRSPQGSATESCDVKDVGRGETGGTLSVSPAIPQQIEST